MSPSTPQASRRRAPHSIPRGSPSARPVARRPAPRKISARVLLIDNYDSFVFNLAQGFWGLGAGVQVDVVRHDAISLAQIRRRRPSHICLSPGPKSPFEAGICIDLIRAFHGRIPILGVCLGHQAIGAAFGGTIYRAEPVHGKAHLVAHSGTGLFVGMPSPFWAARYHSLAVARAGLPENLRVTATLATPVSADPRHDVVMALSATDGPTFGVQFHPESYLTESGQVLLRNFLTQAV